MKSVTPFVVALTLVIGFGQDAFAYIGPGAGLSMVGAVWGLVVAVVAAFGFLLFWPIRKMFKRAPATTEAEPQEKPAP
jgi:uncharacterized YccA/Bax inhibitor family protein